MEDTQFISELLARLSDALRRNEELRSALEHRTKSFEKSFEELFEKYEALQKELKIAKENTNG